MILTPLPPHRLAATLAALTGGLESRAARMLRRIAARSPHGRAKGAAARAHRRAAIALARRFGMRVSCSAAKCRFGWDGRMLHGRTEAYVLLHEIAHYQLAAPQRRRRVEFGLGPGPDTADRDGAELQALIFGAARDREEALASLLGILWEAQLGQPALASLLDQNWLEGADGPAASRHLSAVFGRLVRDGYAGATGLPTRRLRRFGKDETYG